MIEISEIFKLLPHRYPMLLVDTVLELDKEKGIKALKNVTINEDFFNGHFPSRPVMPGVLIIEALAQAAGIYVMKSMDEIDPDKHLVYFMSIEDAKFRKPVTPGDTLILEVTKLQNRGNVWKMEGEAKVDGIKVANAIFSAMIVKKED